jgi:hypothetical protein
MKIELKPSKIWEDNYEYFYSQIKKYAELWVDTSWIPECLEDHQFGFPNIIKTGRLQTDYRQQEGVLTINDDEIIYETASGNGTYTFTPAGMSFEGRRNSFIGGSCFASWDIQYWDSGEIRSLKVYVFSPLQTSIWYDACSDRPVITSSQPERRLDDDQRY